MVGERVAQRACDPGKGNVVCTEILSVDELFDGIYCYAFHSSIMKGHKVTQPFTVVAGIVSALVLWHFRRKISKADQVRPLLADSCTLTPSYV